MFTFLHRLRPLALLPFVLAATAAPVAGPKLYLEGDGHACSGFLRVTPRHLTWKSSFSTCDGAYRVLNHHDGEWTLELQGAPGPRTRSCSLHVINVKPAGPAVQYPMWDVSGFTSRPDPQAPASPAAVLDCPMQSAEPAS